jgi:exosome complex RNA-binding protein Rrp4
LGEKFQFELNIGFNGRIWINSANNTTTIFIMNALERYVEGGETEANADYIISTLK